MNQQGNEHGELGIRDCDLYLTWINYLLTFSVYSSVQSPSCRCTALQVLSAAQGRVELS